MTKRARRRIFAYTVYDTEPRTFRRRLAEAEPSLSARDGARAACPDSPPTVGPRPANQHRAHAGTAPPSPTEAAA